MPTIAIDVRPLQDGSRFRGIGVLVRHMLPFFSSQLAQFNGLKLVLLAVKSGPEFDPCGLPVIEMPASVFASSSKLSLFLRQHQVDGVHFMAQYLVPDAFDFPFTVMVHDLFNRHRFVNEKKDLIEMQRLGKRLTKAKRWMAVSEFTKSEMVTHFGLSPSKISVVYAALPTALRQVFPDDMVLTRYDIRRPYILSLGDFEARKNQLGMIFAFLDMNARLGRRYQYVACIGSGTLVPPILKARLFFKNRLSEFRFVRHCSPQQLAALYRHAACLSFVSKAEGFGLPVLEGLYFGVPVLTANTSSLPEIGQDAVAYADPFSVSDMADAMQRLVQDKTWVERHQEASKRVLAQFSYEKGVRDTLSIFREVWL